MTASSAQEPSLAAQMEAMIREHRQQQAKKRHDSATAESSSNKEMVQSTSDLAPDAGECTPLDAQQQKIRSRDIYKELRSSRKERLLRKGQRIQALEAVYGVRDRKIGRGRKEGANAAHKDESLEFCDAGVKIAYDGGVRKAEHVLGA